MATYKAVIALTRCSALFDILRPGQSPRSLPQYRPLYHLLISTYYTSARPDPTHAKVWRNEGDDSILCLRKASAEQSWCEVATFVVLGNEHESRI